MKGKRVLITGGLGFIGSNLAHACVAKGAAVTIFDAQIPTSGANWANLVGITDKVKVVNGNISDIEHIVPVVKDQDIVFNCAASTSHVLSIKEPVMDLATNAHGVLNVLDVLRLYNKDAIFVQVGTTTQLGKQHVSCADEEHPEFPLDIYSAHKSVAEKYTLIYGRVHGMKVVAVRLPNVYGPRGAIKSAALTFNNYFIGLALQSKPITVFGDGAQQRNIIFVTDAVEGLIAAALNPAAYGDVFFCTGDEHLSIADIAKTTARVLGNSSVSFVEWPEGSIKTDVGDVCISNAKIKKILNWSPQTALEAGLIKTKEYFIKHLEAYV